MVQASSVRIRVYLRACCWHGTHVYPDGSDSSNVVEGTGSAAPTGTGGINASDSSALSLFSTGALTGIAISSLAAISSVFLVLA